MRIRRARPCYCYPSRCGQPRLLCSGANQKPGLCRLGVRVDRGGPPVEQRAEERNNCTVLYLINHIAITSQLCRSCARGELTPTPSTQSLLEFSLNGQARTQTGRFIYPSG